MKKGLTEIVFILDESGSMSALAEDTAGGFNAMLEKQRDEEGEALVSTVLFNSISRVIHDRVPIEKVGKLTKKDYCPVGSTALLDAVGDAVHHIGNVHKYAREEDVPEHTLFIITTDGMENASRRYSHSRVKKLIERQKEKYGWEFIFLGANIDAGETAESMGISRDNAADYVADGRGTEVLYRTVSKAVSCIRGNVPFACAPDWRAEIDRDIKRKMKRR